jgi:hypothetical protein
MKIHVIVITCRTCYRFVVIIQVWLNILSNHPRILRNRIANSVWRGPQPTHMTHNPHPASLLRWLGMLFRRLGFYIHPTTGQARTSNRVLCKPILVSSRINRFCCWKDRGHDSRFLIVIIVHIIIVAAEHFDIYCHKIYQKLHFFIKCLN